MSSFDHLPPLAGLRAFAAFAESGSVVKAAALLNVSHPAISQQLRSLETHLGLSLLDRSGHGMKLTTEGQQLADAAVAGFGGISRIIAALTGADADRPLMITTTASFASGWLVPRLADFRARHPGISMMIDPTPEVKPLAPGGTDLALRYGRGDWPGVEASLIISTPVVVVAAPKLLGDRKPALDALGDLPWLEELGTSEATGLRYRLGLGSARSGGPGLTALPGNLMVDAARDGQGIAVVARAFVEADIAAGRLVQLYEDDEKEGYWLVTRPGVLRPSAREFAVWIRRQAASV
jgi:LysR family glycine cleavage system transcriptional activator